MTMSRFGQRLAAALWLAAVSPAAAETFIMTNGDTINGTVIRSLANTVSIKYQGAGMLQVPIVSVQRVDIRTKDGGVLRGRLLGWSKGVYRLSTEQGPVEASVEDGVVVTLVSTDDGSGSGGQSETTTAATTTSTPAASTPSEPAAPRDNGVIKAGFVYAGAVDDGGRNFMREKGRQALAANPKIDETAFLEIESESDDQVVDAVEQLIAEGANTVFMTGNDSVTAMTNSAGRHKDVRFVHCGSFEPAANIEVVCGRIYQARYLTGLIAGGMTGSNLIGYVAAEAVPEVIVGINAFALGVQSINPEAQVIVNWTNSWYAPGASQQRAEELIERGVDVLTIHQDSPAALQVAERYGIDSIGFQSDMSAFAPSGILTSVVWNWGVMYDRIFAQLNDGDPQLRPDWFGLREGVVGLAPVSNRVPNELIRLVEQRQREVVEGRFHVFTGPIRDIDGDLRIREGRIMTDKSLQSMDYLIQGVSGF